MKFSKLIERMFNGTININTYGHILQKEDYERFLSLRFLRIMELEDVKYNENEVLLQYFSCVCCDTQIIFILKDDDNLDYMTYSEYEHNKISCECGGKHLVNATKLVSNIQVKTGKLVFQNHFHNDELSHKKDKWARPSINSIYGREVLMHELAGKNVGYGQTGNMDVDVCINNTGEIFIMEQISKRKKQFPDLIKKGTIMCEVWRWQCADISVLEEYVIEPRTDAVILNVTSGNYTIEHYYDFSDGPIISKISKV